jgi:hypothetical protein
MTKRQRQLKMIGQTWAVGTAGGVTWATTEGREAEGVVDNTVGAEEADEAEVLEVLELDAWAGAAEDGGFA